MLKISTQSLPVGSFLERICVESARKASSKSIRFTFKQMMDSSINISYLILDKSTNPASYWIIQYSWYDYYDYEWRRVLTPEILFMLYDHYCHERLTDWDGLLLEKMGSKLPICKNTLDRLERDLATRDISISHL